MDNGLQALLNIHSACRLIDKDFIRTSHDSPDRADEGEDLGFDPGVIPEPRDALLHPEADCTRGEEERKRVASTEEGERKQEMVKNINQLEQ